MSFFDSIMPDFNDPNTMAAFGALGNVLSVGSAPRYDARGMGITGGSPLNALLALGGAGMQGAQAGAQGAQSYQQQNIANQMGQLGLQQQQAIQPGQIAMLKGMYGDGTSAPGSLTGGGALPSMGDSSGSSIPSSPADAQYAQAYRFAMMGAAKTGDWSKVSAVLQSWAEHNPALAGAITNSQQHNTYQKTPDGTYQMPSEMNGTAQTPFGSTAPSVGYHGAAGVVPVQSNQIPPTNASALKAPPSPDQISSNPFAAQPQREASFMPVQGQQKPNIDSQFISSDGKPIIAGVSNIKLFKPDPTGIPKYNTPNTETGVSLQKDMQKEDLAANSEMTSNASNIQKEQYRLQQLVAAYKGAQSGTFMAQYPEIAKGLVAAGFLNPEDVHNLSMIQKAIANQAIQVIQQTKDANANLGDAPMRMFGSELANMQKKAENPGSTPEANFEVITDAMGLANQAADMYKGWDAIGGLGNRLQSGATMRPSNYAREFLQNHDPQAYKEAAMKEIGGFKGGPQQNQSLNPQDIVNELRKRGHKIQ